MDLGEVGGVFEHEAGEGDHVEAGEGRVQALVVLDQTPATGGPGEGALNGLITNDKFCLTRTGRLRVNWPRSRGGLRTAAASQLSGEVTRRGEEHAAAAAAHLAGPARRRADRDRPAALGPGLPTPPAVGDDPTRADRGAGAPDPAGGVPCA
jgi:hypothetical protein